MNKNIIQFIVDEDCNYVVAPSGTVKAQSNLTTRIQLITPISASVAVNYVIYDSRNIQRKQYLVAKADKASTVIENDKLYYEQVAGWNIYEADIYAPILSAISRFRTGRVGVSFSFSTQTPSALATNFVDYFGYGKPLPETASDNDYFICESFNYYQGDKLYNKGDIQVWINGKFINGTIHPKGSTETVGISVDPAISYPDEDAEESAVTDIVGALSDEIVRVETELEQEINDLENRVDIVENELDGKLDKVETITEKMQVYVKRPDGTQGIVDVTSVGGAVDGETTVLNDDDKVKVIGVASDTGVITGNEIRDFFTLNIYEAGD